MKSTEARKEYMKEYLKQWREKNREKIAEQQKQYSKQYRQTPIGRASKLVQNYKRNDKKYNRGECTLTARWVLENILNKPCAHCGKSGWQTIGCNRIDNSRPHTEDNVEPCCYECNIELENPKKQVYQYTKDGELVKVWVSTKECGRNGFNQGNVASCCRGELNTYKGYVWSYESKQENLESIATF